MLPAHEAEVVSEEYAATVGYQLLLPVTRLEAFQTALLDLTNGQALMEVLDPGE
ncbi:MAG TPA: DUF1949 domain-containing protein [Archangium sp.]